MSHAFMFINMLKYLFDHFLILLNAHLKVISITLSHSQTAHGIGNFDHLVSGRHV